jgi:hypothetical protein
MLDLDSSRWQELRACGEDGRIVAQLIRRVAAGEESEYGELLNEICHQETVYSAAYAAVPHLIAIAASKAPGERGWPLFVAGAVSLAANRQDAAPLPSELAEDYKKSLLAAIPLAAESLSQPGWEPENYVRCSHVSPLFTARKSCPPS